MRLAIPTLSLCVLLATTAAASDGGIPVGGRVIAPGGAPVAQADVQLLPLQDALATLENAIRQQDPEPVARGLTDASGRFRLGAPHAGLWKVRVEAPGFVPREITLQPLIEPVELPDARLDPDESLVVRVRDDAGSPLAGVLVLVRADRTPIAMMRPPWSAPTRSGITDASGTVRVPKGERERATVSAVAPGLAHRELRGIHGTAATLSLGAGAELAVKVVDMAGRLAAGVIVTVGQRPHPVGRTDESGRFVLHLAAGDETPVGLLGADGRRLETRLSSASAKPGEAKTLTLPDRAMLVGKLIDAETRRAITGGVVWDSERPLDAAVTDRAGGFVLGGPHGGRLRLTAGAPGYMSGRQVEARFGADDRPGPTLVLAPAAAIEGRVLDASGNPVAGAEVNVREKQSPGMMRIEIGAPTILPKNLTDSEGRFRLSPLDPDKAYTVKADAEGFAPGEKTVGDLEPYATRDGVDITVDRGKSVTGTVTDASGRPLRDAAIDLTPAMRRRGMMSMMDSSSAGVSFDGVTDDAGAFRVDGLPDGKFDLAVHRPGFAKKKVPAVALDTDEAVVNVGEIRLDPGERVQGRVTDARGRPLEGVEVYAAESGGPTMMIAMPGAPPPEKDEPGAVTDSAGWFAVDDLAPGKRYTFNLQRTGYIHTSAGPFQLPRVEPVEATMSPASDVSGVVLDPAGEPVSGAQVNMTRSRTIEMGGSVMKTVMMLDATSDADGRFLFEDQEPGPMSLSAVASGYQEAKLDNLEIPEGEDVEGIELPLEAGAVVQGRVFAPDGTPAIGATVQLAGEGEGFMRMMGGTPTDGNGVYRLEGLAPGKISVEAVHDDYPRTVRDIEVKEGVHSLDLEFTGGVEVTGTVVDDAGNPLANAVVRLAAAGRMWGGPTTDTDTDGTFRMPGVQEGSYRIWADAEGYASSMGDQQIEVAAEPVHGVEIRLDRGASIYGTISGLEPERFGEVDVRADGAGFLGFEGVNVDFEGNYRISNLKPGTYTVVASVAQSGKQARSQVTLDEGVPEIRADLQFGSGLTLSGRATQADQPIAGATIYVEGEDIDHTGWNETDHDGRFSIEGLEPGRYRLALRDWTSGLAYNETVDVGTSRDIVIEVPTARVGGRIVDGTDRSPLAGVGLTLTSESTGGRGFLPIHTATTDLAGKFEFGNVADGTWKLSASKKGYSALSRDVAVQFEKAAGDLDLTMDPTEGLTLEARLPSGAPPDELRVAVLDPTGGALVTGVYATGENGRVRLSSVPPGTWSLVVSAGASATTTVQAQAPGAAVAVMLQPASGLRVTVPELADSGGVATVTVRDGSGQPFHGLSWNGRPQREWRMAGSSVEFASLPPGSWSVTVATADGRSWQGQTSTVAGSTAELRLE